MVVEAHTGSPSKQRFRQQTFLIATISERHQNHPFLWQMQYFQPGDTLSFFALVKESERSNSMGYLDNGQIPAASTTL